MRPEVFSSLLSMLKGRKPDSPIMSVVNTTTIKTMHEILSKDDYLSLVTQLDDTSLSKTFLDLILHLLRDRCLSKPDSTMDMNRRARRLMFKILAKMPVIPWSMIVTGVHLPSEQDFIGSGGFGSVFRGELRGETVALKVLHKPGNEADFAFCQEALMWGSLKHQSVLAFLGIYEFDTGHGMISQSFLVSPFMKNGTLAQWRKKANPPTAVVERRILEVAQGMEYIHSEGAIHGDLRGDNILLDDSLHVQITDFGLTRLLDATSTDSGALHFNFAAPELFGIPEDPNDPVVDDPARTQMSDVYAFGCLYYEIYYDNMPFAGKHGMQIMSLLSKGTRPARLPEPALSDEAWEVISNCWERKLSKRPKMKNVVESITALAPESEPPMIWATTYPPAPPSPVVQKPTILDVSHDLDHGDNPEPTLSHHESSPGRFKAIIGSIFSLPLQLFACCWRRKRAPPQMWIPDSDNVGLHMPSMLENGYASGVTENVQPDHAQTNNAKTSNARRKLPRASYARTSNGAAANRPATPGSTQTEDMGYALPDSATPDMVEEDSSSHEMDDAMVPDSMDPTAMYPKALLAPLRKQYDFDLDEF